MKVKCPKCEIILTYNGKAEHVLCPNETCLTDKGNRRQIKIQPNKIFEVPKVPKRVLNSTDLVLNGTDPFPRPNALLMPYSSYIEILINFYDQMWYKGNMPKGAKGLTEWKALDRLASIFNFNRLYFPKKEGLK